MNTCHLMDVLIIIKTIYILVLNRITGAQRQFKQRANNRPHGTLDRANEKYK